MRGADVRVRLAEWAQVFRYPGADYAAAVQQLARPADGAEVPVARLVESFAAAISSLELEEVQQLYTATFDLNPSCPPFLGVYLFPQDLQRRTILMLRLHEKAQALGCAGAPEDADHLASVLELAGRLSSEDFAELAGCCLVPALEKMAQALASSGNPYRFLLLALAEFCRVPEQLVVEV
ncbi:MAG: hypothetical protein Kow00109_14670 [Acidobacteriota bacterium]